MDEWLRPTGACSKERKMCAQKQRFFIYLVVICWQLCVCQTLCEVLGPVVS